MTSRASERGKQKLQSRTRARQPNRKKNVQLHKSFKLVLFLDQTTQPYPT
uniref:Uncharacterized protein n=1 Tax=Populus trichocarpa TaxID=3694 RepID=B9H4Y9_POPTR